MLKTFLDRSFNFSLLFCIKHITSTVNFSNTNPILSLSGLNSPCIFTDHGMKSERFAGHASSARCSQACLHRILSSCSLCTPICYPWLLKSLQSTRLFHAVVSRRIPFLSVWNSLLPCPIACVMDHIDSSFTFLFLQDLYDIPQTEFFIIFCALSSHLPFYPQL